MRLPALIPASICLLLSAAFASACGSSKPITGEPCATAADCGPTGDAVCQSGLCRVFDASSGYGSAKVDLSFGRDMYQVAASGYVHFFSQELPDGQRLECEAITSGQLALDSAELNRLTRQPKYLVFNWSHGGTFFPDNLIQFIRPSTGVIAVAEGYAQLEGQGPRTALGCTADQEIQLDQTAEFSIQLTAP